MKALALLLAAIGPAVGQSAPRFDLPRSPVLTDEVVPIAMSGLAPDRPVTITLRGMGFVSFRSSTSSGRSTGWPRSRSLIRRGSP